MTPENVGNNPDRGAQQNITIQQQTFQIPVPYVAGPITLSVGEADALNQTYAENIRNNFASNMKRAAEEKQPDGTIGRQLVQDDLDAYIEAYRFGERRSSGPRDPVGTEENRLALAAAKALVSQAGKTWKDIGEEKQDEIVAAIVKSGKLRAQAEAIVAARQAAAATDGLNLGDLAVAA